jgi:hypothetical protein
MSLIGTNIHVGDMNAKDMNAKDMNNKYDYVIIIIYL